MGHSQYVTRLCRHARRLGYTRLALTDTDNLCGLWPFLTACRREGLIPIVGAEVTDPHRKWRAVCLVETETGYRNLCRLLTARHMDAAFDLKVVLPTHADGLTVLTGSSDCLENWHTAGVTLAAALPRRPLPGAHPLRRTAARLGIPLVAIPGSFFLRPGRMGSPPHAAGHRRQHIGYGACQRPMLHRQMPGWRHRPTMNAAFAICPRGN